MVDYRVETFGEEGEPLVIIDDFSPDFERLKETAMRAAYGVTSPHYPGVRAQADQNYLGARMDVLQAALTDVFGTARGLDLIECAYSIVSTPPETLKPIQRLPHFDSTDPGRLALLHYFGDASTGGTAFYRHVETRFEIITAARHAAYTSQLQAQIDTYGLPPTAYYSEGPLFERVGEIEARPNRMVIYRGYRLHSGVIPIGTSFAADPQTGRLTLNTFLHAR